MLAHRDEARQGESILLTAYSSDYKEAMVQILRFSHFYSTPPVDSSVYTNVGSDNRVITFAGGKRFGLANLGHNVW